LTKRQVKLTLYLIFKLTLCQPACLTSIVIHMPLTFPFSAIVGQDDMKMAIVLTAIDPSIGGVLVFGDRGTGKSTAVRALAALLPKMRAVVSCPYGCDPENARCPDCVTKAATVNKTGNAAKNSHLVSVPVVDLPLGATEDRVVGALDLERALSQGVKAFEPGLLVDLLIDVAASGENVVEREGLSVRHPARFVLIGSGNPEEGELRPQLLDRFGLSVEVKTPDTLAQRVEVVKRRDAFEQNPQAFTEQWKKEDDRVRRSIVAARKRLADVAIPDEAREFAAQLCMRLGTDGLRGDLTLVRAARAEAALQGAGKVGQKHLVRVAASALRHRLRRNPLDDSGSSSRVERALAELTAPKP
jgi:magnesium chelatase subunit I